MSLENAKTGRVAIVAGLRTPFARPGAAYRGMTTLELASVVVKELVARAELDPAEVSLVVYGQAIPSPHAPNIAREVVFGAGLPANVEAFSVTRGCATSFQSATSAAESILAGQSEVAITGGVESVSDLPVTVARRLGQAIVQARAAGSVPEKLRALSRLSPRDLAPTVPVLWEQASGLTMGEHAERMAKALGVTRGAQDRLAKDSHARAAAAWDSAVFDAEVMHVVPSPSFDRPILRDELVRGERPASTYAEFSPAIDPKHGTVTAGNSSPVSDGASALLLMGEAKAKALGYAPLGYLRSWSYVALAPSAGPLFGPAHAVPLALDRAGLRLRDLDVVDMHEAFAVQVIGNRDALASRRFAEEKLGRSAAIGEIEDDRFNVHGGSLAIGHPFAATGARMLHTVLRELRRRKGQFGLATTSSSGGLGAAIVVEAA